MAGEDVLERIVDLINSVEQAVSTPGLLQLNESLSRYLLQRLLGTRNFLGTVAVRESKESILKPLQELYRIVSEAKWNVQECCSREWIPAAILQAENKEAFFEVLKDLHWCTGVVITASRQALTDEITGTVSISEAERPVFTEHTATGDAEEMTSIRSEVDRAAVMDSHALKSKLNQITDPGTDQAGLSSDDLAIAEHLKSWLAGHEISRNLHVERGRLIGRGGYAKIYRSKWQSQSIAEKFFHAGKEAKKDFDKEVTAMRQLRHPNVVKLVAKDDAECTLLLELMTGSLMKLIEQKTVTVAKDNRRKIAPFPDILETVDVLLQISRGMLYLHDKRMAHRDIKSSNILYIQREPGGYIRFKVADFGLARPKTESAIAMTADQGTLQWTAPELFLIRRGKVVEDGQKPVVELKHALRADVYSFGITCFEVVTGEIDPYGLQQCVVTRLAHKVAVENLRPTIPEAHVPPDLADLMQRCWAKDPSDRPTFAYICNFLQDFKASLLTGLPFRPKPWEAAMDLSDNPDPSKPEVVTGPKLPVATWGIGAMTRFLTTRFKFLTDMVEGSRLSAMVLAVSALKWLFITRFKSLEEITDKDVRSRQMKSEILGAATIGSAALHSMRPVKLSRGDQVTVARINAQSEQVFLKNAFYLTQLQEHPNLPKIIGYSVHRDGFYLVFKPDSVKVLGSLHEVMSLSADVNWRLRRDLTWEQRYKIALAVGQALACLHELSTPIVHGNLSSRNIMLEEGSYNPRLFNFYTTSMFRGQGGDRSNFLVNDTRGWDAPEKDALHGEKSALEQDIFSFGVLLLVLVAGRDAFTSSKMKLHIHIVDEAWQSFNEGRLLELENQQGNGPRDEVFRVLKLALFCVQEEAHKRPTIKEAVNLLLGKAELKVNTLHILRRSSLTPVRVRGGPSSSKSSRLSSSRNHASDLSAKVARGRK